MRWQVVEYNGFGGSKPKFRVLLWFDSTEELSAVRVLAGLYFPSLLQELSNSCLNKDFWSANPRVSTELLNLKEKLRRSYESA